jgi:hypothetical protein
LKSLEFAVRWIENRQRIMNTGENQLAKPAAKAGSVSHVRYRVMKRFSFLWFSFQLMKVWPKIGAVMRGLWKWINIIAQWIKALVQWAWELFCWCVIPAGFGYLAYLSIYKQVQITFMQVILVALTLSPWVLRMMARHLSEFSIGPKGVSGKMKEGVMTVKTKRETTDKKTVSFANEKAPVALANDRPETKIETREERVFQTLQPESKKILRTLWNYQCANFPGNDNERWGFSPATNSPGYMPFSLALLELLKLEWVFIGNNGMVFLSNEGLEFCKKNSDEVSAHPFFYSKFGN